MSCVSCFVFCVCFFFAGRWRKVTLELTTLEGIFMHVVRRFFLFVFCFLLYLPCCVHLVSEPPPEMLRRARSSTTLLRRAHTWPSFFGCLLRFAFLLFALPLLDWLVSGPIRELRDPTRAQARQVHGPGTPHEGGERDDDAKNDAVTGGDRDVILVFACGFVFGLPSPNTRGKF